MTNPFAAANAAHWYAQGRPFYHDGVLAAVADTLNWHQPLADALDVCCGTGLSTIALLPYASRIVGVDAASEMLAQAAVRERITYQQAPAERLPFADSAFDLVSLCEAFHWLDQARFLDEARRVLRPGGSLLIYGGGIRDTMDDVPAFTHWFQNIHLPRYPTPKKAASFWNRNAPFDGWDVRHEGQHEKPIPFTAPRLADFFLSISNTLLYLEQTGETASAHRDFLIAELLPFFEGDRNAIRFVRYGGLYTALTPQAG